jgi:hypothetical protein
MGQNSDFPGWPKTTYFEAFGAFLFLSLSGHNKPLLLYRAFQNLKSLFQ